MRGVLKGNKELIAILKKIPKEMQKDVEAVLEANAQEIESEAKRNAPVDTGKLKQSIKSVKIEKLTFTIRANDTGLAPYAPFVEFGTRFQKAQPYLYPAFFKGRNQFINDLEDLMDRTFNKI